MTRPAGSPGRAAHLHGQAIALATNPRVVQFMTAMVPTMAALGVQFVAFAITARGLGIEAFGHYAAVLGLAAIGVELTGLGGADLMVRATSRDPAAFPGYFGNLLLLAGLTLPPVCLLGLVVAVGPMATTLAWPFVLMALIGEIAIGRVSSSVELAMVAHGHTTRASLVRVATAAARLIAAGGYFLVSSGLEGWILIVLVQSLALSGVYLLVVRRLYGRPVFHIHRAELADGAAFGVNQTARAMQGNIDRVVLARFADAAALGAYAAGSRVMMIGLFPLQVMTRILYPQFFRHGQDGIAATRRFALKSLPAMLAVSLLALAAVVAVAQIVPFALGEDFARSRHVAMLLALSLPLIAMQYLAADVLTGAGHQHVRAVIYGVAAIVFGFLLVAGARLGGVNGLIGAYLGAHALLMTTLWLFAFVIPPRHWTRTA